MNFQRNSDKFSRISSSGSTGVAPRFHFAKRNIEALNPRHTRYYVYDDTVRGLAVAVQPSGRKTFLLYRKINGCPERIFIGPYPDLSPEQARKIAEQMNGVIAEGGNPARERREVRAEMTL